MNLQTNPLFNIKEAKIKKNSGVLFDVLNPSKDDFKIEDFAYTLAGIYRFGASGKRLTVAEHCIRGSYIIQEPEYQLYFLLHEGGEGILGFDMCKPIKQHFPEIEELDEFLNKFVLELYGLNYSYPAPEIIKSVDNLLLKIEKQEVFNKSPYPRYMNPTTAYKAFLSRFNELQTAHVPAMRKLP